MEQRMAQHARISQPKRHTARNVGIGIAIAIVLLAAIAGICGYQFYRQAMQVKAHEEQVIASLSVLKDTENLKDPTKLDQAISQAQTHATQAQTITKGALWSVAAAMPVVGDDITTVRGLADVAQGITSQTLPKLSQTITKLLGSSLSGGEGKLNMQPIIDAQSNIKAIASELGEYNKTVQSLPKPHIGKVQSAYSKATEQFEKIASRMDQANIMIQGMPLLLGSNGPRNYILVAQTTSEQRSSGGLVGSMGLMSVENGAISIGDFHSNGEFVGLGTAANGEERSVFDGPLAFSMDIRDVFAVPEIGRVSELVNYVWQQSPYKGQVDGVVAVDPVFIQEMVRINGNVTLDDGRVLTGDNTAEFMLNTIYKEYTPEQQDFYFEYLASSVMKSAFSSMNFTTLMKVAKSMGDLAKNRHFYAYTFHEDEAKYLQGSGLAVSAPSDETKPAVGVYLNEQNPSKLGWYIDRSATIQKTGTAENGGTNYHVTYTLHNRLDSAEMATATDYILGGVQAGVNGVPVAPSGTSVQRMLFYAPAGGSLSNLQATGDVRQQREAQMDGKTLTTNVAYIAPGDTVTFEFDVTTAPSATEPLSLDTTPCGQMSIPVQFQE